MHTLFSYRFHLYLFAPFFYLHSFILKNTHTIKERERERANFFVSSPPVKPMISQYSFSTFCKLFSVAAVTNLTTLCHCLLHNKIDWFIYKSHFLNSDVPRVRLYFINLTMILNLQDLSIEWDSSTIKINFECADRWPKRKCWTNSGSDGLWIWTLSRINLTFLGYISRFRFTMMMTMMMVRKWWWWCCRRQNVALLLRLYQLEKASNGPEISFMFQKQSLHLSIRPIVHRIRK